MDDETLNCVTNGMDDETLNCVTNRIFGWIRIIFESLAELCSYTNSSEALSDCSELYCFPFLRLRYWRKTAEKSVHGTMFSFWHAHYLQRVSFHRLSLLCYNVSQDSVWFIISVIQVYRTGNNDSSVHSSGVGPNSICRLRSPKISKWPILCWTLRM